MPYDVDDVWNEANDWTATFQDITGDRSISVGINEVNHFEFEVWLDRDDHKTKYFADFNALEEFVQAEYPDADWDY
jgi:hypothetical protein